MESPVSEMSPMDSVDRIPESTELTRVGHATRVPHVPTSVGHESVFETRPTRTRKAAGSVYAS